MSNRIGRNSDNLAYELKRLCKTGNGYVTDADIVMFFSRCARLFCWQDGKSIWLSRMRRWGATELASFPPRASQMLMSLRATTTVLIFIMAHYDFYEYMALRTYICKKK